MSTGRGSSDIEASLGTAEGSLEYWRTRHVGRPQWASSYWNSQQLEERRYLVRALQRVRPFESLMELGCNAGPNLALVRRAFPAVSLTGIDINEDALRFCRQAFADEGLGSVDLREQSLYELDNFAPDSADIVLTSGVLIHIPPQQVRTVVASALRIARKAVIMVELHAFVPELESDLARPGKWCRSFWELLSGLTTHDAVCVEELPPTVGLDFNDRDGHYYRSANAVITVMKTG